MGKNRRIGGEGRWREGKVKAAEEWVRKGVWWWG